MITMPLSSHIKNHQINGIDGVKASPSVATAALCLGICLGW